jgi:hypothetical protein
MATEAQVAANRRNAEKSTGPRTAEGKAAVSQNAVKHGLLARHDVIRGEDQEEFELYREELFWELEPVGTMESRLAERIVSLAWRLRRAERIQNEAFDALLTKDISSPLARLTQSLRSRGADQPPDDLEGCDGDPALGRAVVKDFSSARVLDRLLMYERRIESSLYRTMAELQKLRRMEKQEAWDAGTGCRTRRDVKDDTRITANGGHSPPYEAATQPPADREPTLDCAKQSQLRGAGTTSLAPSKRDEGTPEGVTPNGTDFAKQSQFPPAEAAVCSVPVRASPKTHDVASLRSVTMSEDNCAKQSQSARGETMNRGSPKRSDETPDGVTTSGETAACKTKPMPGPVGNEAKPAAQRAAGNVKQSQFAGHGVQRLIASLRAGAGILGLTGRGGAIEWMRQVQDGVCRI